MTFRGLIYLAEREGFEPVLSKYYTIANIY